MVVSVPGAVSTVPHEEQKFASDGLRCPQLLQNTPPTLPRHLRPAARASLFFYECAICGGVEKSNERVRAARLDLAYPTVPIRVVVQLLGSF
jgi:hypothetical protein